MTVGLTDSEFNIRRWEKLVTMLSMDVVRPFYDLMGLWPREPDSLQRVLRQEIVVRRKRSVLTPTADPPWSPQEIIRAVANSLGTDASRQLIWWERHILHIDPTRDHLELRKWATVLENCRHEPALWNRLGLSPEAQVRFRQSRSMDEYQRRQAKVDTEPLSDWDLHLYALHLYDDNLYLDESWAHVPDGPRLYMKPTIGAYQGYLFWNWQLKTLGADRIELLWQEARQIVEEEELRSARELPHPSVLELYP